MRTCLQLTRVRRLSQMPDKTKKPGGVGLHAEGRGLMMREGVDYPSVVRDMREIILASPSTERLAASLAQVQEERKGTLLVRHFATRDDLGNAFRTLHALRQIGKADRETYRYLMYACCKYHDLDLGLYVMEHMLYDGTPDFRSFKRLFDALASAVDLRLWVAYDVLMWFYPMRGFPSNALRTTAYITELMKTLGMRDSARSGRGFVTLPNYRGEPVDVFAGMFEEDDPNYPELLLDAPPEHSGEQHQLVGGHSQFDRLRLIPEEFEDRNNMAKIVARNRERESGEFNDEAHLVPLEQSQWSVESLTQIIRAEKQLEEEHLTLFLENAKKAEIEAQTPAPSLKDAVMEGWKRRMQDRKMNRKD